LKTKLTYWILILGFSSCLYAQQSIPKITSEEVFKKDGYNPLAPANAAFYSAIVPGMGQLYNKDYWKFPVVYGALAIPIYYYSINNTAYKRYRKAFKLREAGLRDEFTDDAGTQLISREGLMSTQRILKQNRDTSLLTFAGLYVLQVLEASVSAHLLQFNVDDKISFDPQFYNEPISNETIVGLSMHINF
jgi:hypothetical protein